MQGVWCVDFEGLPIGPRPDHYPPKPTGVAIRHPDTGESVYMSWGHPTGNNCTMEDGARALQAIWDDGRPIVFHNAKFDLSVCYEIFGLPKLPWDRVHDTMILAFLMDPYAQRIGLKELGEQWLGMPKDERDAVNEWIVANKAHLPRFEFILNSKKEPYADPTPKNAGAWIGFAPGELVGPYAIGDVVRTFKLFQMFYSMVIQAGMGSAYDIERQVLPIFYENERDGLRVDYARLQRDTETYQTAFDFVEAWLRWRLNAPDLNIDADQEMIRALSDSGVVTEFARTKPSKRFPNGQPSIAKDKLHPNQFNDPDVAQALGYRNRLKTCLTMFMKPWLKQAASTGRIYTNWNQVAGEKGGTRTGRPSTREPNLLNISKSFEGKPDGYEHPAFLGVPPLPIVRVYVLPEEGHVVVKRDFSGQELRVFAHFEQGDLMAKYHENPSIDVHNYVGENIADITGEAHWTEKKSRTALKALNFQGMYGGGVPALMAELRISQEQAKEMKAFHNRALPGRKILADALTQVVRSGMAIRTWGGRLYVRPALKRIDGRVRDFDYRLINYMIQGSAADITKHAMVQLTNHPDYDARFMLQVYDELNVSAPIDKAIQQMRVMNEVMDNVPLRVQMLSDGSLGLNWGEMRGIDEENSIEARLAELREIHDE